MSSATSAASASPHSSAITCREIIDAGGDARATVRNMDAWYDAFDVRPGRRLYLPRPPV